jgi:8-oxo-dGTP pyrophosphatase MutT (NUDIX family)
MPTHKEPRKWKCEKEELVFSCHVYSIYKRFYRHPDGRQGDFFTAKCHDWVQVIPLTANNELVMVRQYRFGIGDLSWEFPGGVLNPGEDALVGGMRELEEETGFCGENPKILGKLHPNPALQSNTVHFMLLENCRQVKPINWDEFEELQVKTFPIKDVMKMVENGEISHGITVNALFYLLMMRRGDFER